MSYSSRRRYNAYVKSLISLISRSCLPPSSPPSLFYCNRLMFLVRPTPTVPNYSVYLRRAATQEEFFPRNLSSNPINYDAIKVTAGDVNDPTVEDLIAHVAENVGMPEGSSMIECLVSGKILNRKLVLRHVQEKIWKDYIVNNNMSPLTVSTDIDVESLPPMIVSYRLIGVDGEATEENIDSLDDGDDGESGENAKSKEVITKQFTVQTVRSLLNGVKDHINCALKIARRDDKPPVLSHNPGVCLTLLEIACAHPSNRYHAKSENGDFLLLQLLLSVIRHGAFDVSSINSANVSGSAAGSAGVNAGGSNSNGQPSSSATHCTFDSLLAVIHLMSENKSEDGVNAAPPDAEKSANKDAAGGAPSRPFGDTGQVESQSQSLSVIREALDEEKVSVLIHQQPTLVDVLGRLIPTLLSNSSDLLSLSTEITKSFNFDSSSTTAKQRVYLATVTNATEESFAVSLIQSGFVLACIEHVNKNAPPCPPVSTESLHHENSPNLIEPTKSEMSKAWDAYLSKPQLTSCLQALESLSKFDSVKLELSKFPFTLTTLFYISAANNVGKVGIECEKLLEKVITHPKAKLLLDNLQDEVKKRKKALAQKRREKAMTAMLSSTTKSAGKSSSRTAASHAASCKPVIKTPAWMLKEMEGMEEDEALVCIVCGEGYTFKPEAVMGVYCHVTRQSVPQLGATEGNNLFTTLPDTITPDDVVVPDCLYCNTNPKRQKLSTNPLTAVKGESNKNLKLQPKAFAEKVNEALKNARKHENEYSRYSSLASKTVNVFSSLSASFAIHSSCHNKAVIADRNHPKDPKSEWQGATMRNSRVKTNAILPLTGYGGVDASSYTQAIEKYYSNVTSATGVTTSSTSQTQIPRLFLVLHDIKILLELLASGSSVSEVSQGGSITSNSAHLLRLLCFARNMSSMAELGGEPGPARAKSLPSAFVVNASLKVTSKISSLTTAASFAAVCSLAFESSEFWATYKVLFLKSFVKGARSADTSTFSTSHSNNGARGRKRSNSLSTWTKSFPKGARSKLNLFLLIDKLMSLGANVDCKTDQALIDMSIELSDYIAAIHRAGDVQDLWARGDGVPVLDKVTEWM